jgi:hypothetical protein
MVIQVQKMDNKKARRYVHLLAFYDVRSLKELNVFF